MEIGCSICIKRASAGVHANNKISFDRLKITRGGEAAGQSSVGKDSFLNPSAAFGDPPPFNKGGKMNLIIIKNAERRFFP